MSATLVELAEHFGGRLRAVPEGLVVDDVVLSSVDARPGALFAALPSVAPGSSADGRQHLAQAAERGAAAVLVPDEEHPALGASGLPIWLHEAPRRAVGQAAARVHGDPSRTLDVIAVTGTNGKTTVAALAAQLLEAAGRRPALFGTIANRIAGEAQVAAPTTTPDATVLQRLLARHAAAGGDSAVCEASSHGLDQERLAGLTVRVAVFTNLTRDHLDYHVTEGAYRRAKRRLFEQLEPGAFAVLPAAGDFATELAGVAAERGATVVTYGIESRADLNASRVEVVRGGFLSFLDGMGISWERSSLPLTGRHNLENALAALAAVLCLGADPDALRRGFAAASLPAGRLQPAHPAGHPFRVLVDYAHTPDALCAVLDALRAELDAPGAELDSAGGGRLIAVFGCGGDRDPGKRPAMGAAVAERADFAVLTNDNPRGEDPAAIAAAVVAGIAAAAARPGFDHEVQLDRAAAIRRAVELAGPGDVVLIAGKGHEPYQLIEGRRLPFSDLAHAREACS